MEETKKCPYCGEEILATAKKCKHCGEWLEDVQESIAQTDSSINNQSNVESLDAGNNSSNQSELSGKYNKNENIGSADNTNTQLLSESGTMGFKEAIRVCLKEKYATFKGRASGAEFWKFSLFVSLITLLLLMVEMPMIAGGHFIGLLLVPIVGILLVIPIISAAIRRLHDTGRSGWAYWFLLVPFIGVIILWILLASKSQPCDNKYGPYVNKGNGIGAMIISLLLYFVSLGISVYLQSAMINELNSYSTSLYTEDYNEYLDEKSYDY